MADCCEFNCCELDFKRYIEEYKANTVLDDSQTITKKTTVKEANTFKFTSTSMTTASTLITSQSLFTTTISTSSTITTTPTSFSTTSTISTSITITKQATIDVNRFTTLSTKVVEFIDLSSSIPAIRPLSNTTIETTIVLTNIKNYSNVPKTLNQKLTSFTIDAIKIQTSSHGQEKSSLLVTPFLLITTKQVNTVNIAIILPVVICTVLFLILIIVVSFYLSYLKPKPTTTVLNEELYELQTLNLSTVNKINEEVNRVNDYYKDNEKEFVSIVLN